MKIAKVENGKKQITIMIGQPIRQLIENAWNLENAKILRNKTLTVRERVQYQYTFRSYINYVLGRVVTSNKLSPKDMYEKIAFNRKRYSTYYTYEPKRFTITVPKETYEFIIASKMALVEYAHNMKLKALSPKLEDMYIMLMLVGMDIITSDIQLTTNVK